MSATRCARCGKAASADAMVYSRHTRLHFCTDFQACDRRLMRQRRKATA